MSACRRNVLANQFETRSVVEDVETVRSSELFSNTFDELRGFGVGANSQVFCDLQERGSEGLS